MPLKPPCLECRRSSNFSSSAYNFKISLYATKFKDFLRLREPWHCIEFQFGFVLGPVLARDKNTLPRNRILEIILDSEAHFGFSKVHGFRLGTLYVSSRAERAGFDECQSKWLAEPFHRFSHYLAFMLKVCFFIWQYVLSKHLYDQWKVSKREQIRTKIGTTNQTRHSRI